MAAKLGKGPRYELLVDPQEKSRWSKLAGKQDMGLAEWIRATANTYGHLTKKVSQ